MTSSSLQPHDFEPAWEQHLASRSCSEDPVRLAALTSRAPHLLRILPEDGTILDAGSGDGKFVYFVGRTLGGMAVGLDAAPSAVRRQHPGSAHPAARFLRGDVRRTGLRDASLDGYLSMGVIEHFPPREQRKILEEASRCLRAGGVAFLTVPNVWSPWTPVRALWAIYRKWRGRPLPWQRNLRLARLRRLSEEAGMQVEEAFHMDLPASFELALCLARDRFGPLPHPLRPMRRFIRRMAHRLEGSLPWLGYHCVVIARKR